MAYLFRALRNLYDVTANVLFVESMCIPGGAPVAYLRDEGLGEDQGLRHVALYPSETCLIKMLYRAGFRWVYRSRSLPNHQEFQATVWQKRLRTILIASKMALDRRFLVPVKEPVTKSDSWTTAWGQCRRSVKSLAHFIHMPWTKKLATLNRY